MSSRIDSIVLHWVADFQGRGTMTIDLKPEDQDDPRVRALVEWWEEKSKAAMAAAGPSGDPFPTG